MSELWRFFKKISYFEADCNLCGKRYRTGNTTNLKKHLVAKHYDAYLKMFGGEQRRLSESSDEHEGVKDQHRWTYDETVTMLQGILKMMKESDIQLEQPTARQFYEDLKYKYTRGFTLTWHVMKSKLRHLKRGYLRAVEWKESFGVQLSDSDQTQVQGRIKSICPHYDLLEEIFGTTSNADPIGISLPEKKIGGEAIYTDYIDTPAKKARKENLESLFVPKAELLIDEQDMFVNGYEESQDETFQSNSAFDNYDQAKNSSKTARSKVKATDTSLEERALQFEIRKFEANYKLQLRRISLEEKKFDFEKEKFEKIQRLRKYEIDKQFPMKIQPKESNKPMKTQEGNETTEPDIIDVVEVCPESHKQN